MEKEKKSKKFRELGLVGYNEKYDESNIIRPDDLSLFARTGFDTWRFRSKEQPFNPLKEGPVYDAAGGAIYFDNKINQDDFYALMRILRITESNNIYSKKYQIFRSTSLNPKEDGYLQQMRIVSRSGLRFYFKSLPDKKFDSFPDQKTSIEDTFWKFIEDQKDTYTTNTFDSKILGMFGGDGWRSWDVLSFGFMVENSSRDIYRIWSRGTLLTK
jgi:hypothetical protein